MKRITSIVLFTVLSAFTVLADDHKTGGNGTTWTLSKLANVSESGVKKAGTTFTMTKNVEIVKGDRFEIESGIKIMMADNVQLCISCDADFTATSRVLFTATDAETKPYGIFISNDNSVTNFKNIDFEYAGVRSFGQYGLNIDNCTFRYHNGVSGMNALGLGSDGAEFTVTNCTFEECRHSAIGGAANYRNPIILENCVFKENGTANSNTPQINLTTADNVTIRNCKVTGNPAHNMVGGIVVSNLINMKGELNTLIEGNEIRDNRFGLATYCEQNAVIRNNTIVNNMYETNPMNGGSGINIYDPYKTQNTMITGNYIERNLWGITVIGGKDINIGKTEDKGAADYNPGLNIFSDNGNGGVIYDLYNNSDNLVYAQGNFWKTVDIQDEEHIETVIFHKKDNPSLGEVIFMPALTEEPAGIDNIINDMKDVTSVEIYSLNGTLLTKMKNKDFSGLKSGSYIIRITTDNGVATRKITF